MCFHLHGAIGTRGLLLWKGAVKEVYQKIYIVYYEPDCAETLYMVCFFICLFLFLYVFCFSYSFDLDIYGGTDTVGLLPLCLQRTADVLAPHLRAVFQRFVRLGCVPACWRQANVTLICEVHCPPVLPNTDQFYNIVSSVVFVRLVGKLVSDKLWNAVVCFQYIVCLSETSGNQ